MTWDHNFSAGSGAASYEASLGANAAWLQVLAGNTSGTENTANGTSALYSNTTGDDNAASSATMPFNPSRI